MTEGKFSPTRRRLIVGALAAGAGLYVAARLAGSRDTTAGNGAMSDTGYTDTWVEIRTDGRIVLRLTEAEMGQGVTTSLPLLVAEELAVAPDTIELAPAPLTSVYGEQTTGGSTSIREAWPVLRRSAATARVQLVAAAAARWGVDDADCRAADGRVHHGPSGRSLAYGALALDAARLEPPAEVALTAPGEWHWIGHSPPRRDVPAKLTGEAVFGIDIDRPGALVATVAHPPAPGREPVRMDTGAARAVAGVHDVVPLSGGAVAVVADGYWAARRGLDALAPEWPPARLPDDAAIAATLDAALDTDMPTAWRRGTPTDEHVTGDTLVSARYRLPLQAHACLEPPNATAAAGDDGIEVWTGTQSRSRARDSAVAAARGSGPGALIARVVNRLGLAAGNNVTVHGMLIGGGFGRRLEQDYVAEAVALSRTVGAPVKVIWSREEDLRHDVYRPPSHHLLEARLGPDGLPRQWRHRIAAPSVVESLWPGSVTDGLDPLAVEGAVALPYAVPRAAVGYAMRDVGVPVGMWRSVGHSYNAFAVECFVDELAVQAGIDPVDYRLRLLADAPRLAAVVELAAARAGWGSPRAGHAQGIAAHACFGSYVAQVAEVSRDDDGGVRVHRVVCAVDCGIAVHPDTVAAQMEGAIAFALTATLYSRITRGTNGTVESNFHDFPLLRFSRMPRVDVHILPSREPPGGVGEPGVPPLAPAVANAVSALTGHRVRTLPIRLDRDGQPSARGE
ncbi:molybdopterin-dependent oxidoreductase [Arhodomonas aquaeolei]|uniref:xanthine dehydrogenase family protein molybdopterin-binding subunit n=1 Tax=Arhodomonas aquaeolei TaxID=2369 RepID=UPI00216AA03F|nr:molybdopterin cofactor-binding domain-containing protein [Arhodomonas aquaeolei]MCS4505793.1 molybdopterin-dependent oxidoreductase [Arhodomonas aquaeolei]